MNNSIFGLNTTVGERELQSTNTLTELEVIQVKLDLANQLDNDKQSDFNREVGRGIRDEAFSLLVNFANTDPAHVAVAVDDYADLIATQNDARI